MQSRLPIGRSKITCSLPCITILLDRPLVQDSVGLLANRPVRQEVVRRPAQVDGIEGIRLDEGVDRDRLVVLGAELFQFVGVDHDVLVFRVLVAGDDVLLGYLAVDGATLLVLNAAVALGVELVEVDFASRIRRGGVRLDGDGNETEFEEPFQLERAAIRRSGNGLRLPSARHP